MTTRRTTSSRMRSISKQSTTRSTTVATTTTSEICSLFRSLYIRCIDDLANNVLRWLEWTDWSNCSESCGSGIRVRTRLCSNTEIDGTSNPCESLGGSSFEIEACQSSHCKRMLKGNLREKSLRYNTMILLFFFQNPMPL